MYALGVDIGGVIISRTINGSDTSFFGSNFLATPPTPGVFEALARLTSQRFGDQVYFISKSKRPETIWKSLEWLEHHRLEERTGIPMSRVHFCPERADKAAIALRLDITDFVDDKLEVVGYLRSVKRCYLYDPLATEVRRFAQYQPRVAFSTRNWTTLADCILAETRTPS